MRVTPRFVGPAAAAAAVLALASCAGDAGTDAGTGTGTEATTPAADDDGAGGDAAEEDAAEGDGAQGDLAECVEGEWDGDLRAAGEGTLGSLELGELRVEPEVETDGDAWVTFDGTTMTTDYRDRTTTVTLSPVDAEGEVVLTTTLDGSTSSSYTVDGDTLTVGDVDVSDLTTDTTVQLDGEDYSMPGLEDVDADTVTVGTAFDVTCTEDELRLVPRVGDVADAAPDEAGDVDEEELESALEQVLTRR